MGFLAGRILSVGLMFSILSITTTLSAQTAIAPASSSSAGAINQFVPIDPFVQAKEMQRGVNIVGYDPLWKNFDHRRFKQTYFKLLRDGGFNTVRVNLQAFQHMDDLGRLSPEWFKSLDWIVDNALANDLSVIIDEHDYELCGKDAITCRSKLTAFWEQVAPRYKNTPHQVMFEILNEPNQAITISLWNTMLKELLAVIRQTNPDRNVVIGPSQWNNINSLAGLELPNDRHIIATVHYYLPMRFTHQGAWWSKETATLSGITWGTDAEKEAIAKDFAGVQEWSKANGRPILLGEFGAYDKGDMDSRVKYISTVARTAESLGWAWTYWQFDSDFIVYNVDKDAWVEAIHKALVP